MLGILFIASVTANTFGPVRNDGLCGATYGNAVCRAGNCCSKSGWCGATDAHCKSPSCDYQCDKIPPTTTVPSPIPSPSGAVPRNDGQCGPAFGNSPCLAGNCCSQYGYCGSSSIHCDTKCAYQCPVKTSEDCQKLISLAKGLNMDTIQPAKFADLKGDCCSAFSLQITCTNNRVVTMDWSNNQLTGKINGVYLPSELTYLSLQLNLIEGPIPGILPLKLQYLLLQNNKLSGGIPSNLPSTLTMLSVSDNQMGGLLPTFPNSLVHLVLSMSFTKGNNFSGALKLQKPTIFYINDQSINDVVVQDTSAIIDCDISKNPLFGNPHIANLSKCRQDGLVVVKSQ